MNSSVKKGKLPLNKTNYFNNLKKKTCCKDIKEQERFNKELLNCIDILCNRVSKLEEKLSETMQATIKVAEWHNEGMEGIGTYLNDTLTPLLADMASYMPDEFKEKWTIVKEEAKDEETVDGEVMEGGESMDA
jgi:hypothetical protein